ncbi:hypothetical protein ACQ4PT_037966 [Festuca glaucescens]
MESTGSCTLSTAPAVDTSLAIRDDGNMLPQQKSPASSRAPPSASPEFKCKHCPRTFASARALGGHQKAHRNLHQVIQNPIQKEHRRLAPAGPHPQVRVSSSLSHVPALGSAYFNFHMQLFNSYRTRMHNFPSSARSGVVPLFAGTGGLAPAQPSSAATGGGGHVGGGSHVGSSRQVNQKETSQYFSWLLSSATPSFIWQTQTGGGTSGQPSFVVPAPVAEGNGGTGDRVHIERQQDMPEVNLQEETTDGNGIDLTLRL